MKQAGNTHVLLKTRNNKGFKVGFFIPSVPMLESRMSFVAKMYSRKIAIRFDRMQCLYGGKAANDGPLPPPAYPAYLYDDIVKKFKKSLNFGIDSAYLLVTWKNNKVYLNNSSFDFFEVTQLIERNPKSIFLLEISEKQKYSDLIKLMDHLFVSYYLVLEDFCQKKYKKSVKDISTYALREIEKVLPFRYYILSRSEQAYINDIDE
jgi:hypothetical protein